MVFAAASGTLPPWWCLAPLATLPLFGIMWFGGRRMRWRGGVARWIVFLSLLVAAIIVVNAIIVQRFVSASRGSDGFLALTSRQRLLAQRMEFLLPRVLEGESASQPALQRTMDSYDRGLAVLEKGGRFDDRVLPKPPGEMAESIATVKRTWDEVRPALKRLLTETEADLAARAETREKALSGLAGLVDESFQLVLSLEEWRDALRRSLLYLVGGASLLGVAALIVWFKLAWDHLVAPVRRLRDHALRAKERPTSNVPKNEIEAVAQAVTELSSDMGKLRRERARMRDELKRAEADYEAIFDNAVAGILRSDVQGTILLANRALARMLGYSSVDELMAAIGDVHRELFADQNHRARFEELHRRRGHVELETTVRRKDKSTIWVLESATSGVGRDGTGVYETVLVDITPMKQAQDSLRQLSALLLRSQDRERRRIARELHDSTGQLLAALEMNLSRIDEVMPLVRESLSSSVEIASECTKQIRSMSYLLHPPMLEELGLVFALRDYTRGFSQRSGIDVTLDSPQDMERLDTDTELALFRVVQEALVNIQRHSESRDAVIRIVPRPGWIRLEIEDHGKGIAPERLDFNGEPSPANMGVGLRGMEERLRQLGGRTAVESRKGRTIVRAEVPLTDFAARAQGEPKASPGRPSQSNGGSAEARRAEAEARAAGVGPEKSALRKNDHGITTALP